MSEPTEHDETHPHHHTLLSLKEKIREIEGRIAEAVRDGVHLDSRRLAGFHLRLQQLQAHVRHLLHHEHGPQ